MTRPIEFTTPGPAAPECAHQRREPDGEYLWRCVDCGVVFLVGGGR